MKKLFVDTAGWMSCADGADPLHGASCMARDSALESGMLLVTSDYVIDETLTLIQMRPGIAAAKSWWAQIDGSARLRWEWIGAARWEKAHNLFFRYRDKGYSFTDCTSFVVMHELKLKQALTSDRHFRQMGFDVVPPALSRRPK